MSRSRCPKHAVDHPYCRSSIPKWLQRCCKKECTALGYTTCLKMLSVCRSAGGVCE